MTEVISQTFHLSGANHSFPRIFAYEMFLTNHIKIRPCVTPTSLNGLNYDTIAVENNPFKHVIYLILNIFRTGKISRNKSFLNSKFGTNTVTIREWGPSTAAFTQSCIIGTRRFGSISTPTYARTTTHIADRHGKYNPQGSEFFEPK